jgi:uroporphyrinogen-III synthase
MPLLVTRPAPQAREWVARAAAYDEQAVAGARRIDARALPLIEIGAAPDPAAVAAAWTGLSQFALVMFVSAAAAEWFFAAAPQIDQADTLGDADGRRSWPQPVIAAATGPGTAAVLRRLGLAADQIVHPAADSPQFDSEALWRQLAVRDWLGCRVLIVRGDGGRDWLAERLRESGAHVDFVQAYCRSTPAIDAEQQAWLAAAQAEPADWHWLFSSSEAIHRLSEIRPGADWSHSRAWSTHPRIAAAAREAGFGRVEIVAAAIDAGVVDLGTALQTPWPDPAATAERPAAAAASTTPTGASIQSGRP